MKLYLQKNMAKWFDPLLWEKEQAQTAFGSILALVLRSCVSEASYFSLLRLCFPKCEAG